MAIKTELKIPAIPPAVKKLVVLAGMPCPQDGDSQKGVSIRNADSAEISEPAIFEQNDDNPIILASLATELLIGQGFSFTGAEQAGENIYWHLKRM